MKILPPPPSLFLSPAYFKLASSNTASDIVIRKPVYTNLGYRDVLGQQIENSMWLSPIQQYTYIIF